MNDPIPIRRDGDDAELSADEYLRFLKERHDRRVQWTALAFVLVVIAGFLTPLVVFLTRLALGG